MNAKELELYTGKPGVDAAAKDIEAALLDEIKQAKVKIKKGQNPLKVAKTCRNQVFKVLTLYQDFGATDTEPEWHVVEYIEKELGLKSNTLSRWD